MPDGFDKRLAETTGKRESAAVWEAISDALAPLVTRLEPFYDDTGEIISADDWRRGKLDELRSLIIENERAKMRGSLRDWL